MGKGVTFDNLGGYISLEDPHGYISFEDYAEQETSPPVFQEGAEEMIAFEDLDFELLAMSAKLNLASPVEAESAESLLHIEANPSTRIDDPVKMYLKEMGMVSLLTREGEIEIAKRIQEGAKEVVLALLETPLGVKAILDIANHVEQEKPYAMEEGRDFLEEEDLEQTIHRDHWRQLIAGGLSVRQSDETSPVLFAGQNFAGGEKAAVGSPVGTASPTDGPTLKKS